MRPLGVCRNSVPLKVPQSNCRHPPWLRTPLVPLYFRMSKREADERMRFWAILLAFFAAISAGLAPAWAEKRVALVIGNGAYTKVPQLLNPANDARAITALLRSAGFQIAEPKLDLDLTALKRALSDFEVAAQGSDIAAIFYSGHGIQVNRQDYLVPVDAALARDVDVEDEAVSLDRLMRAAQGANRLRLVILDACRDNPFEKSMKRLVAGKSVGAKGLAVPLEWTDTLIAFAARAGTEAKDGDGTNSPFTTALLRHLTEPGLDVQLALRQVRDDVLAATGRAQEPFTYGSLGGGIVALVGAKPAPVPVVDTEQADFAAASSLGTVAGWDGFLGKHKAGPLAEFASRERRRLAALQQATILQPSQPLAPLEPTPPSALAPSPDTALPLPIYPLGTPKPVQTIQVRPDGSLIQLNIPFQPDSDSKKNNYSVQLAAPNNKQDADDAVNRLYSQFRYELGYYKISVIPGSTSGKPVYRVRIVNLNQDQAIKLCKKLKNSGGIV